MLLGLIPQIGDLCEINPLAYNEVPCEIIDVNHDEFQYKVLFNSPNNLQEVYWIVSDRINWIARKYKILDVTEIENDLKNKTALIIKATPYNITYHETDDNVRRYELYNDKHELAEIFILNSESRIAQYVLDNPEKQKIFNLTHFKNGVATLKSGITKALFHEDY